MAITYPTTLDDFTNPNATDALNSPSHSDQHSDVNDAVEALEAKVGADSSAVEASHDYKLAHLTASDITDVTSSADELNKLDGTDATATDFDKLHDVTASATELNQLDDVEVGGTATGDIVTIDGTQTLTNKTLSTGSTIDTNVTVTEVLKKVYPVGSIYIATVSTAPATLLGFGTWSAFGEGRVMVGKAGSGTFSTGGATGGAETHTNPLSSNGYAKISSYYGYVYTREKAVTAWTATDADTNSSHAGTSDAPARGTELGGATDSGSSLQPYIVVYMWERTA